MALVKNSNISPRTTPTREDLEKMIADSVGKALAEKFGEEREKALDVLNDPDKLAASREEKARAEKAEADRRARFEGLRDPVRGPVGSVSRSFADRIASKDVEEMTSAERAKMFARCMQLQWQAQKSGGGVDYMYQRAKALGQTTIAKALQATDFDQGGFMVPHEFSSAIIEELVARSVYRRAGPVEISLAEGGLSMSYESDGADAQWVGEGTAPSAEETTGGQINLSPKKLIIVHGMSNDILRALPGVADQLVLNSIMKGMSVKLDSTLLRGQGTGNEPIGLAGLCPSANQINVTSISTLTAATLVKELLQPQNLLETANIDLGLSRPAYFSSPRVKHFLRAQVATDGVLFPELETSAKIFGAPLDVTSNIPITLDASGTAANDESEIYFVAMDHMYLGVTADMVVDMEPGAAYKNSSGTVVSAFSQDETPVRVIGKFDHAASHRGAEIVLMDQVDWALV